MRIAIAGASGTGKTTLMKAIAEKFSLPINPVGARSVALEMGFDNPYDVDKAGRRVEFQKKLFEAKRYWELSHDSFVTDRTYLDNLTYCALHMAEHLEDDAIKIFTEAMSRYQIVLQLPLYSFQDLSDPIRKQGKAYHEIYDRLLRSLLGYNGQNVTCFVTICGVAGLDTRRASAITTIEWAFGLGVFHEPGLNLKRTWIIVPRCNSVNGGDPHVTALGKDRERWWPLDPPGKDPVSSRVPSLKPTKESPMQNQPQSDPAHTQLVIGAQAAILLARAHLQALDLRPYIEEKAERVRQIAASTYEFNRGAKVSARVSSVEVEARQHLSDAIDNCEQFLKAPAATLRVIEPAGEMLDAACEISKACAAVASYAAPV